MSATNTPPPLPPRSPLESGFQPDDEKTDTPPPVPPKTPPALPERTSLIIPTYTMQSPMSLILIYRQGELYESLEMGTPVGSFANLRLELKEKLELLGEVKTPLEEFWVEMASHYSNKYIRSQDTRIFEERILKGIPEQVRAILYLKIMNVRSIMDAKNYLSLLRKAMSASQEDARSGKASTTESETVQVYEMCGKESTPLLTNAFKLRFISGVSRLLTGVPNLNPQEHLAILFKIDALFQKEIREEYYYKASRGLEHHLPNLCSHLELQRVAPAVLFKNVTCNLIMSITDDKLAKSILDLFLFEGFDYFIRLALATASNESEKILSLQGSSLDKFLSGEFLECVNQETVEQATKIEIPIIIFENKYRLKNSNICSGNDHELSNLKETGYELETGLMEMESKIENLKKINAQVEQDNTDYNKKLADSSAELESLVEKKRELEERYSQLTMNENLTNTIKANRDISKANAELSAQVEELQLRVAKKREKLLKRHSIAK